MALCQAALDEGVFAQAIRPPTVPAGTARLRLAVMASHGPEELRRAARVLGDRAAELGSTRHAWARCSRSAWPPHGAAPPRSGPRTRGRSRPASRSTSTSCTPPPRAFAGRRVRLRARARALARRPRRLDRGSAGMRGLFVTGTDTGVGKTVASACLLAAMRAAGEPVRAFKPVLTGLDDTPAPPWPADHELLALAAGTLPAEVAPPRFGPAVSPHLAAELAGRELDPQALVARARDLGARAHARGRGRRRPAGAAGQLLLGLRPGGRARPARGGRGQAGARDDQPHPADAQSRPRGGPAGVPASCSAAGPRSPRCSSAPTARRSPRWARSRSPPSRSCRARTRACSRTPARGCRGGVAVVRRGPRRAVRSRRAVLVGAGRAQPARAAASIAVVICARSSSPVTYGGIA